MPEIHSLICPAKYISTDEATFKNCIVIIEELMWALGGGHQSSFHILPTPFMRLPRRWDVYDRLKGDTFAKLTKMLFKVHGVPENDVLNPMNAGHDWWDVFGAHGLNAVAEQLQSASTKPQMQLFDHVLDISLEPPKWLIEGIMPEYAMCALVAPSNTGKSYVAVDMACAVANGIKWHNEFDVAHGNVFYIIGEGRFGVRRRVEAWHRNRGVTMDRDTTNLHFSRQGLNVRDNDSIAAIKADMRLVRNIKLIVIDTLARSFGGGNENAPQDIGEFINNCDELMHEFGTTVLIIHHFGKDAQSGARGHSSFFGTLDTSMKLKKFGSHDIQLICEKQKDAPEFEKLQFAFVTLRGADETPVLQLVQTAKTSDHQSLAKMNS